MLNQDLKTCFNGEKVVKFYLYIKREVSENMDIFDYMRESSKGSKEPLASRMRPKKIEDVVGQEHILSKDKLLYRAIKADKLSSVITRRCMNFVAAKITTPRSMIA